MEQMDPGLLEEIAQGPEDEEIDVVLRLRDTEAVPDGVRVIDRFGDVVTGRVHLRDVTRVHDLEEVESIKAATRIQPADAFAEGSVSWDGEEDEDETPGPSDVRRPATDPAAGRGVFVAVLDWFFDLPSPAFRHPDGRTRVAAFWDQRQVPGPGRRPAAGYGRVLLAPDIDRCLQARDPYQELNYRPWDSPDAARGTHGTHVASIAAGSPHLGVSGVAPAAALVLVHLADPRPRRPGTGLGTSVSLLEALAFVDRAAGSRPCSVNISAGRHAGDHRGESLVERAVDHFVTGRDGRMVSQSAGNYYRQRAHAAIELVPGQERHLDWLVDTNDPTPNELEAWYPGRDVLRISLRSPDGDNVTVPLGEAGELRHGGATLCRVYHRRRDPNTGFHHVQAFMQHGAPGGRWQLSLVGLDVADGRVHAWVERDHPRHQSRFAEADAVQTVTLGSIACGFHTVAVGALDAHTAGQPVGPFSSSGPTADGRRRPNLLAPGVRVLAARSAPGPDGGYGLVRKSGTSMAAPHVAGAVACLYEASGHSLSVADVREALISTLARPPDIDEPYRAGAGCLDLDRLLTAARSVTTDRTPAAEVDLPGEDAVWTVIDGNARVRGGPPAFTLVGDQRIARWTRVRIRSREGRFRDVVGVDGTTHGWTAGSNLRLFLKDQPDLVSVPVGAAQMDRLGALLGVPVPAVRAVWHVESGGRPHVAGQTLLRFESHLLWRRWGQEQPAVFDEHFQFGGRPPRTGADCAKPWRCHHFRSSSGEPFRPVHVGQAIERDALRVATRLAGEDTALRCASFGGPQILGSNHERLGYATPREMVDAFVGSEGAEVLGFFDFVASVPGLLDALAGRRWDEVARLYNGPGQVPAYAAKLAAAERVVASLSLNSSRPTGGDREDLVRSA
jgi:subtilisin family serine protease